MSAIASFYREIPTEITVNYNWSCRPSDEKNAWKRPYLVQPATVKSIQDCLARGPFVAMSAVGPTCYSDEPTEFRRQISGHKDLNVYGWKAGANRVSDRCVPVIICGVQQRGEKEHIYFVRAKEVSENGDGAIGKFKPMSTDQKVYVASMKTFADFEFDMFPPVSAEEEAEYRSQEVVPTVFAGQPDLLALMQQGKITVQHIPRQNS